MSSVGAVGSGKGALQGRFLNPCLGEVDDHELEGQLFA